MPQDLPDHEQPEPCCCADTGERVAKVVESDSFEVGSLADTFPDLLEPLEGASRASAGADVGIARNPNDLGEQLEDGRGGRHGPGAGLRIREQQPD